MKRNKLKDLGLTEEQIDEVMSINGADIQKAKSDYEELTEKNKSLEEQISQRDKDLKDLQAQAKDNEDLSSKYKELQDKYKADKDNFDKQIQTMKFNSAVDKALSDSGVRNIKTIKGLLNNDNIKLSDDGTLSGLDDQIKSIKKSDPYLFNEGQKQQYEPSNGKPVKTTKKLNDMNLIERAELKQDNPEAYKQLVSDAGYKVD